MTIQQKSSELQTEEEYDNVYERKQYEGNREGKRFRGEMTENPPYQALRRLEPPMNPKLMNRLANPDRK